MTPKRRAYYESIRKKKRISLLLTMKLLLKSQKVSVLKMRKKGNLSQAAFFVLSFFVFQQMVV